MLPADGHVHSQFSWDAPTGDMHATCARAVEIGLPALAFTEHVDLTRWNLHGQPLPERYRGHVDAHGSFLGDALQVEAYLAEVDRCREDFPGLRIWSGLELSEPHWHPGAVADLVRATGAERLVGSVHALPDLHPDAALTTAGGRAEHVETGHGYLQRPPLDVVRAYLAEVAALAASDAPFAVLAHVDYPLRTWPTSEGPVPWDALEDDVRTALAALAASGRALELNTRRPLEGRVLRWWHEAGGDAVAFGSDAHHPEALAHGFREAADLAQACGFRPGPTPFDLWGRA